MTEHKLMTIELTIEGISERNIDLLHRFILFIVALLGGEANGGVGENE